MNHRIDRHIETQRSIARFMPFEGLLHSIKQDQPSTQMCRCPTGLPRQLLIKEMAYATDISLLTERPQPQLGLRHLG